MTKIIYKQDSGVLAVITPILTEINPVTGNPFTIEEIAATDLGVNVSPRLEQLKVEEPPKRKAGIKVANVAELVQKLKNEAMVI